MPRSPTLPDGRKLDSNNFVFHDQFRKITQSEKYGIALASGIISDAPPYSIVLSKSESVIARALGFASVEAAVEALEEDLKHHSARDWRLKSQIVATLNFAADHFDAWQIARTGADAIVMEAHTGPECSDKEKNLLFSWLGDAAQHSGGYQKHAIVWPRYQLIRVKEYPAKEAVHA